MNAVATPGFRRVLGPQVPRMRRAVVRTDQVFASGTLANVTGLSFPVRKGRIYALDMRIIFQSDTQTVTIGAGIVYPSMTTIGVVLETQNASGGAAGFVQESIVASATKSAGTQVPVVNTDYFGRLQANFVPSADGTVVIQAATETGTTNVTLRRGTTAVLTDFGT